MKNEALRQIPMIRLRAEAESAEAKEVMGFRYAGEHIGERHQLGGTPTWIQGEDVPVCPYCGQAMSFYGQLDSIGDQVVIGDCGLIYIFFCFDCNHAEAKVQSF